MLKVSMLWMLRIFLTFFKRDISVDIEEIRKLKTETEEKILELLKDFYNRTTMCPIKLDIERLDLSPFSYSVPEKEYLLNSVILTVKFL